VSLTAGDTVDQYKVESKLGYGAMGEVYLAVDQKLGRKVALKILSETHRENAEVRARFVREARAVAAISHPNVVQVFTIGEYDGRPYLAMEYLRGRDLMSIVRESGPLDSGKAAAYTADAAKGLQAAAGAALSHRDVKPSNLMLLPDGQVKVTDFGLAKPMAPDADAALTATGVVVGTPDYIAPEQARGEPLDERVDIYALGCSLFVLLAGRPPYRKSLDDNERYLKVVARHLREPAPDPRQERPEADLDDDLVELQLAMMAKKADDRPAYDNIIATCTRIAMERGALAGSPSAGLPAAARRLSQPPPRSAEAASLPASGHQAVRARASGQQLEQDIKRLGMSGSALPSITGRGVSPGVIVVTLLALATFALGLFMYLRRDQAAHARVASIAVDAAPLAAADAAPPPGPVVPAGMLLVQALELEHPFFVSRVAVTNAEYAEWQVRHRFAPKDADRPVTDIPYDYAVAYAKARGARLVRASEWDSAIATPSFVPPGMKLWEWVDEGDTDRKVRAVRGVNQRDEFRKAAGDATVTFRLARDLP
jgi:serine/threonine-protein kinase